MIVFWPKAQWYNLAAQYVYWSSICKMRRVFLSFMDDTKLHNLYDDFFSYWSPTEKMYKNVLFWNVWEFGALALGFYSISSHLVAPTLRIYIIEHEWYL